MNISSECEHQNKQRELFLRQKELLFTFLEKGAISQAQFEKSFGDLCRKMGFPEECDRKDEQL